MEREQIETKLEEIGAGAAQARSELDRLIDQVEALRSSFETAAETPEPGPAPDPSPPTPMPDPKPGPPMPEPAPTPPEEPDPVPPPQISANDSGSGDSGARLVAMKMAVDGGSREEIAAELEAKFPAADRDAVLEDVLARAGR